MVDIAVVVSGASDCVPMNVWKLHIKIRHLVFDTLGRCEDPHIYESNLCECYICPSAAMRVAESKLAERILALAEYIENEEHQIAPLK